MKIRNNPLPEDSVAVLVVWEIVPEEVKLYSIIMEKALYEKLSVANGKYLNGEDFSEEEEAALSYINWALLDEPYEGYLAHMAETGVEAEVACKWKDTQINTSETNPPLGSLYFNHIIQTGFLL